VNCPVLQEGMGAEPLETRYNNPRYDNVNDYNTFTMGAGTGNPMLAIDSTAIAGLNAYSVVVAIVNAGGELPAVALATDALRITVTVQHQPTGLTVRLQGYRLRYAPNSP
jgi:hypothetical protein